MQNRRTYLLISFFLICIANAHAQDIDVDTSYQSSDSIGTIEDLVDAPFAEDNIESETTSRFEAITSADKISITPREVDDSAVSKMRKDGDFWYVNEAPVKEKPKEIKEPKESFLDKLAKQLWFRNLLWVLVVGGFIAVLIWFIISSDIQLFKRNPPPVIHSEEDSLINQSIFDIDYDAEIQKAIAVQNYRLAVRLLYLQTLKNLSERNIINYKQERTNSEYLVQLFDTAHYKDFFRLTRHFECVWYGQFAVTQGNFDIVMNDFSSFKQRFI